MKNFVKTTCTILVLFLSTFHVLLAQCPANMDRHKRYKKNPRMISQKGDLTTSLGIGLLPGLVPVGKKSVNMPLSFKADYSIAKYVTLGVYVGYASTISKPRIHYDGIPTQYHNKSLKMGLRATGHIQRDRFDYYGGVMLGRMQERIQRLSASDIDYWTNPIIDNMKPKELGDDYTRLGVHFSGFVGVTYYPFFNKGVFVEFGGDVSLLSTGIRVKI